MVKFSYTYTLASFLNGYDGKFFSVTLRDSSLSSIYLYQTGSANGDVVIVFRTELTAGEKTILDTNIRNNKLLVLTEVLLPQVLGKHVH
jgi:hypothetical protein